MRSEWVTSFAETRSDEAKFEAARAQFLAEMEDIDFHMSSLRMQQLPDALRGGTRGGDNGVPGSTDAVETRNAGQIVVEDERFAAWAKQGVRGESPTVELRALVAEGDGNGSSSLLPVGQPYLVNQRRQRLFVRDLIGVQQTGLSAIPYVRELNPIANQLGANTVSEGNLKPEATIELTPDIAPVEVIAVTLPVTTQIVEDGQTLMGYINGRLAYMLKVREEQQVINGNGASPNLKGILSYSGVQTASGADTIVVIGNAIGKIELVDGFADGIAMNPADYWAMVTKRHGGAVANDGGFDVGLEGAWSQSPTQYVWGLPVVRANGVAATHPLVGNFGMGATLFDRSQSGVRVFEQHSDYAARNQVLLRGEERVALAVNRPDFFVNCTIA